MTAPVLLEAMRAARGQSSDPAITPSSMLQDLVAAWSVMREVVALHEAKANAMAELCLAAEAKCAEVQSQADRVPALEAELAQEEVEEQELNERLSTEMAARMEAEQLLTNLRQQLDDENERYIALRLAFDQSQAIADARIAALESQPSAGPAQQSLQLAAPAAAELPAPPAEWTVEIGERDANNAVRSLVIRPAQGSFGTAAPKSWRASIESKDGTGNARVLRIKAVE